MHKLGKGGGGGKGGKQIAFIQLNLHSPFTKEDSVFVCFKMNQFLIKELAIFKVKML